MITKLIDNFLSKKETEFLIKYYEKNRDKSFLYRDVNTLECAVDHNSEINFLFKKLQLIASSFNSRIDWCNLCEWPTNSNQKLHFDKASAETSLSSIIYLNDSFTGGETYYEDGTVFKPVEGRGLFFDGNFYKHGVKKINKGVRYTVATWYKKN